MKCPVCNTEMVIAKTGFVISGGKLFREMRMACRNKKCGRYQKETDPVRNEVPATVEETTE